MFKDRPFNLALIISIAWHLTLILCFTIVVAPANLRITRPSTVSFFGPILEKTAFEMLLNPKAQPGRPKYALPLHFDKPFSPATKEQIERLNKTRFKGGLIVSQGSAGATNKKEIFGDFKLTPSGAAGNDPPEGKGDPVIQRPGWNDKRWEAGSQAAGDMADTDLLIEGPLAEQEVLFKTPVPVISRRISSESGTFMVKLKVTALSTGFVDEVFLLVSSGDPNLDLVAINHIKRLRFAPFRVFPKDAASKKWGTVRIKFRVR